MRLEAVFLVVCGSRAVDLEVDGELSFDLQLPNALQHSEESVPRHGLLGEKVVLRVEKGHVTAGSVVECVYQYPEKKQIDAILSNMMNVLTKVFVRAHDFFKNEDARRAEEGDVKGEPKHPAESRFRVVATKETQFFEHIYHNMTNEYSEFYNSTVDGVVRSARDPCQHQAQIKQVWRELLDNSMATFRRAALRCVQEHLKIQPNDERLRKKLGQFLVRELGKVRSNQLHLLCDHFQLCYYELL